MSWPQWLFPLSSYRPISLLPHCCSSLFMNLSDPHTVDCFSPCRFQLSPCEGSLESRSVVSDSLRPHGIQSMEFSRPEYCSGWPFPSPGDLPNPGIEPGSSALQEDSLLNYQGLTRYNFIVASFCFHFSESYSLVNSLII